MEKKIVQKSEIKVLSYIREVKLHPKEWYMLDKIYIAEGGFICREILTLPDENSIEYYKARILAASRSRFATPIIFWLYEGDTFLGWGEYYLPITDFHSRYRAEDSYFLKLSGKVPLEIQKKIFLNHCLHQYDLATYGYVEMDLSPPNWILITDPKQKIYTLRTFDKDAVHSIESHRWGFKGIDSLYFSTSHRSGMSLKVLTKEIKQEISYNITNRSESEMATFWKEMYKKYDKTN
ncbi:hypothetical protein OAQ45_01685 [Candidatus Marinimicrobia bacterium]|nr:hypothetical protein [Candidatus Neomarinimicrobiota bacterium]